MSIIVKNYLRTNKPTNKISFSWAENLVTSYVGVNNYKRCDYCLNYKPTNDTKIVTRGGEEIVQLKWKDVGIGDEPILYIGSCCPHCQLDNEEKSHIKTLLKYGHQKVYHVLNIQDPFLIVWYKNECLHHSFHQKVANLIGAGYHARKPKKSKIPFVKIRMDLLIPTIGCSSPCIKEGIGSNNNN